MYRIILFIQSCNVIMYTILPVKFVHFKIKCYLGIKNNFNRVFPVPQLFIAFSFTES